MRAMTGAPMLHSVASASRRAAPRKAGMAWVEEAVRILSVWIERVEQRRRLATLPDRLLKDIGISRCDALHEARKPFWRS